MSNSYSVVYVKEMVDSFLTSAELLYKVLEADTHESRYHLLGDKVAVTITRKVYTSAAGDILEKGKVKK